MLAEVAQFALEGSDALDLLAGDPDLAVCGIARRWRVMRWSWPG